MRFRGATAVIAVLAAGCARQGTVTFLVEAPALSTGQSPLGDARRDSISLVDEASGMALGTSVTALGPGGVEGVGPIPIGTYDVRLSVTGGGELLGLARARGVMIQPGVDQAVTLHLRKPIFYYGSSGSLFVPEGGATDFPAAPLMSIDTTLDALPPIDLGVRDVASATAATHDGQFLLAAIAGEIRVVTTADQSVASQSAPVVDENGQKAKVVGLAVSDDDAQLAVITESGFALLADLAGFLGGASPTVKAVKLPEPPRRVAFSSDGAQVAVLTSASGWAALDCARRSSVYLFAASSPEAVPQPTPLAHAATDVAFTPPRIAQPVPAGAWVYASPCPGGGIVTVDGKSVLPGDFYSIGVAPDRLIAVPRTLVPKVVDVDPDDPTRHDVTIPFGEMTSAPGGMKTLFSVSTDTLDLTTTTQQSPVEVRLQPMEIVAFETRVSPDGAHVALFTRTHYSTTALRYVDVTDTCLDKIHCDVTATRDLYRVTVVDAASGNVTFERVLGVADTTCSNQCFECIGDCLGDPCRNQPPNPPTDCRTNFGFVPAGGAILMGLP